MRGDGGSSDTPSSSPPPSPPSPLTLTAAADQLDERLLDDLRWWLFISQGDNACLSFLDGDDHDEDKDDKDKDESVREEVFLALAPAVIDEQRMAARHKNNNYDSSSSWPSREVRQRRVQEMSMVWRRVRQVCRRRRCCCGGARQTTAMSQHDDCHTVELVSILLRCVMDAPGGAWWPPSEFEEEVLRHSNVAIVLGTYNTSATPRHATHACLTSPHESLNHVRKRARRGHRLHRGDQRSR
jgi:hypothetical protein